MLTKITAYLIALAIRCHLFAHTRLCDKANKQQEQAKRAARQAAEVAKAAAIRRSEAVNVEIAAGLAREAVHAEAAAERAKYGY